MPRNARAWGSILVVMVGILLASALPTRLSQVSADHPQESTHFRPDDGSGDKIGKQMKDDMDKISIGTATRFHDQVLQKCLSDLSNDFRLGNEGSIGTRSRSRGQHVKDTESLCLSWHVYTIDDDDPYVGFSFWISLAKTEKTLLDVDIAGVRLFINTDEEKVDEKVRELGKRSVREILNRLKRKDDR